MPASPAGSEINTSVIFGSDARDGPLCHTPNKPEHSQAWEQKSTKGISVFLQA